jgi:adenylate cyclase
VFIQATAADNALSGEHMTRASWIIDLGLIAAAGGVAAFAASALPVWGTALSLVGLGGGIVAVGTWLVARGVWTATVAPLLALLLSAGGTYAWKYIVEDKEKRRVKRLFGRYVSKDVFAQLMENPSLALLGGERRGGTVLRYSRFYHGVGRSTPEAVVAQLNEYFEEMVKSVRHRGRSISSWATW